MAYAQVQDVVDRLGRDLDGNETTLVNARLDDIELVIKARIPDLDTRALDAEYMLRLVMVESDAVVRYVRNPTGIVGESDGSYSYRLNWSNVSGGIGVEPHEWRLLGVNSALFQIQAVLPVPWETIS